MTKEIPQHELARQWRERKGFTRSQLSKLVGYSETAIADFEAGRSRSSGNAIGEREWQRYRLACAAVTAEIEFDWQVCRIDLVEKWVHEIPIGDTQ